MKGESKAEGCYFNSWALLNNISNNFNIYHLMNMKNKVFIVLTMLIYKPKEPTILLVIQFGDASHRTQWDV